MLRGLEGFPTHLQEKKAWKVPIIGVISTTVIPKKKISFRLKVGHFRHVCMDSNMVILVLSA